MQASGKRYVWHGSRSDKFRVWNISDIHWMAKGCAENDLRRDLKEIEHDSFSLWIGGGDYCDFIGYRDKRFDPDAIAEWVPLKKLGDLGKYGMEQIRKLFYPIRHKCLGLLLGNHEQKYEVATEHELLNSWLCAELEVPYLGYSCMFDLVFCRVPSYRGEPALRSEPHGKCESHSFRVFAHHGAGYAQTPGGKLNRLVGFMNAFEADLYFCGHVHDRVAQKEPVLGIDKTGTRIVQRERLGVVSGSYLKTYSQGSTTYGEMKGYRPTSLGAAIAEIHPETRSMKGDV